MGWVRSGDNQGHAGLAVTISNADAGGIWMQTGRPHARWQDTTRHQERIVQSQANGWAEFPVGAASVSVWTPQ